MQTIQVLLEWLIILYTFNDTGTFWAISEECDTILYYQQKDRGYCPEGLLMELENDLSETVDQALLTAST